MDLYTTVRDFIETFRADPRIGTYTFAGGQTTEALSYLPVEGFGYSYPPSSTSVTGVEVVLLEKDYKNKPLLGESKEREHVEVWVKDWGGNLTARRTLTQELFNHPNALYTEFRSASERLGSPDNYIITFYDGGAF